MGSDASKVSGPDLALGIDARELAEGGLIEAHVGGEPVLLARSAGEVFAVGAKCTHYGAPLADGLVHDGTVRCPWHHACFSLRTGEALGAPAFDPIARWRVAEAGGRISSPKNSPAPAERGPAPARTIRAASSSSAGERPRSRRPRCCAGTASTAI
jgi:nitrite reductase/ring-hydroxylating ferredoxin subunit